MKNYLDRLSIGKKKTGGGGSKSLTLILFLLLGLFGMSQTAWADKGFEDSDNGVKFWWQQVGKSASDYDMYHGRTCSTKDLGTVEKLYLKSFKAKLYQNWDERDNLYGGGALHYNVHRTSASVGSYTEVEKNYFNWNDWSSGWRKPDFGHSGDLSHNLLSGLASGKYTFEYYITATSSSGDLYCSNNSANFKATFTYNPLTAVSGFSSSVANSGGGDGGSSTPYIVFYNQNVTLTVQATACSDANAKLQFSFDNGANWTDADVNNQATTTIKSSKTSSNDTKTVKYRYYNSADDLSGTVGETTIYYRSAKYNITLNANTGTAGDWSSPYTYYGYNVIKGTYSSSQVSKTGYRFDGWYKESTQENLIADTDKDADFYANTDYTNADGRWKVTEGKTLYAGWTANTYTVTLNKDGGSEGTSSVSATFDAAMPTISSFPSKSGYNFEGYFENQNGQGTQYYNADGTSANVWDKAAATTIYAYWTPKKYTVTLSQTYATTQGTTSVEATYNATLPAIASLPSRTGYTFGGYNTNVPSLLVNNLGAWQSNVSGFTDADGKWIKTTGATLDPIWNAKSTTVTMKANGGKEADQTFTATFDAVVDASGKTPNTRDGYDLKGYYNAASGGNQILNADLTVRTAAVDGWLSATGAWKNPDPNADIFAQWTAHQWTITLDDNEGSGGSGSKTATYGSSAGITSVIKPTRDNYNFAGYYDDQAGNGVQVYDANGDLVASAGSYTDGDRNWKYDNNVKLYAKWNSAGNYVVTLDAGTGVTTTGTTEVAVKKNTTQGLTASITTPTKTGYTFGGYFTSTSGGTQAVNADGSWTIPSDGFIDNEGKWIYDGNYTFKAHWDPNQTVITFVKNGGTSGTNNRTLTYNSTQNLGNISISKTGYTFNGYYTKDGTDDDWGTQLVDGNGDWIANVPGYTSNDNPIKWIKTTTDPMNLYAKWTEKMTTVTLSAGVGGSVNPSAQQSVGVATNVEVTANPFTGYTFNAATGWAVTGNAVKTDANPTTLSGNGEAGTGTLTATFTETMHTVEINGGTSMSTTAGIATTGTATAATAETGKHFTEWTIPTGITLVDCEITDQTITFNATADDIVITANYEDTDYTLHMIVLPAGKGTTVPTKDTTIHYGKSFTIKAIPNPGYEFVNWVSSETGGKADIDFKAASAGGASVSARKTGIVISNDVEGTETGNATLVNPNDASLTANFQIINYTIKYNTNEGTAVADGSYTVETETFSLPTTTKTGFAFAGWFDNAELEGDPVTQIAKGSTGNKEFWAKWETVHVYLEGRTKVKDALGNETVINAVTEPWNLGLKDIPMEFNSTDGVYYLNTHCTTKELASYINNKESFIRVGVATGSDGAVTCYSVANATDFLFTDVNKGKGLNTTNNSSFYFRNVENYESGAFARRNPVMYRFNPADSEHSNQPYFSYCAPLLTMYYNSTTANVATMTGFSIALANCSTAVDGLTSQTVTYQYKKGTGAWTDMSAYLTLEEGEYTLRAVAFGNNDFGQHVDSVKSNEITVTVTTPAVSAEVTHVNGVAGKIIRINDRFTIKHTVTGVPAEQSVQVCYHWASKPAGSQITKDVFTAVGGDPTSVWTTIDVAGDYEIEVSVSTRVCEQSSAAGYIKWMTYTLPIHVKGDEITVYAKLDKSISDWDDKYVHYWKSGVSGASWPGHEMSYIGKDSTDYEWYSHNITNYKTYAGGNLLFNDGTTTYGKQQTTNLAMPNDDAFYMIKTVLSGGKRTADIESAIDVTKRVVLMNKDLDKLYQYVTITLEPKGVFVPYEDAQMSYTYELQSKPAGSTIPNNLNGKNYFTPDEDGTYTVRITCTIKSDKLLEPEVISNDFNLVVAENPLVLKAYKNSAEVTSALNLNDAVTLTVTTTGGASISSLYKTFTVIEPGTKDPITFKSGETGASSSSYTLRSSGTFTFGVVLTDGDGVIAGKAQCIVTVNAKALYIKHPFKNTSSVQQSDWGWRTLTYNEIDGTYQYSGDDAYFHKDKVANVHTSTPESSSGLTEYTIQNPDNLEDNTKCLFVYDVTTDKVTVYDLMKRLYRIKSICADGAEYFSNPVTYKDDEPSLTQEISFFAANGGQLVWQKRETAADNWEDVTAVTITTTAEANGIYTATPTKEQTNFTLTAYTGDLSVFTQLTTAVSNDGTPSAPNGKLTKFVNQTEGEYYNYYWVKYCTTNNGSNVRQAMATIGNSINNCIATTLPYYELPASANVRYAYSDQTNSFTRTYLAGSGNTFLRIYGDNIKDKNNANALTKANMQKFDDGSNWVFTSIVYGTADATHSATAVLMTEYNSTNRWILAESGLEADPAAKRTILDENGTTAGTYKLHVIYDYKTNRITSGWDPVNEEITSEISIPQLITSRTDDGPSSEFTISDGQVLVTDQMIAHIIITKTMFDNWTDTETGGDYKTMFFWFSVPYEFKAGDIYGFNGQYRLANNTSSWEIQSYRGEMRDAGSLKGTSPWKRPSESMVLDKNAGYVLAVRTKANDFKTADDVSQIRFFIPSTGGVTLKPEATVELEEYAENKDTIQRDWHVMAVPVMNSGRAYDNDNDSTDFEYVYRWTWAGGGRWYEPIKIHDTSADEHFNFMSGQAYMVQGHGNLTWTYDNQEGKLIDAPKRATALTNKDFRIDLNFDGEQQDKTYILYRTGATRAYEIGRDLEKIENAGRSMIYSELDNKQASLCLSDEDGELIPITVVASKDGEYTIRIPKAISGVEPVLYDYDGSVVETYLNYEDYTIELSKGTYTDRFFLGVRTTPFTPTNLDNAGGDANGQRAYKFVDQNGKLYILRDGKIYNATGSVVE